MQLREKLEVFGSKQKGDLIGAGVVVELVLFIMTLINPAMSWLNKTV
jgi:hypothetical protein